MKRTFTLLLIFISAASFAASSSSSIRLGHSFKPLVETSHFTRSVVFKKLSSHSAEYDEDRCPRYKGMTIAGGVLLGCGAGALGGGVYMIRRGIDNTRTDDDLKTIGLIWGGAVVSILGAAMTITGTVFLAIGATKLGKYCKKSERQQSYYVIPKMNGVGLACRF